MMEILGIRRTESTPRPDAVDPRAPQAHCPAQLRLLSLPSLFSHWLSSLDFPAILTPYQGTSLSVS